MASILEGDRILINIPASEIVRECRFIDVGTGGNSEVGGFYLDDDEAKLNDLINFFDDFQLEFYIDSKRFKNYISELKEFIYPYKDMYANKMESIDEANRMFSNHDVNIKKLFISDSKRYLKFVNSDRIIDKFRLSLFEGVSNLIIKKTTDKFLIYPELKSLSQLKNDFFRKTNLKLDEIMQLDEDTTPRQEDKASIEKMFRDYLVSKEYSEIYVNTKLSNIRTIIAKTKVDIYSILDLNKFDEFTTSLLNDKYWQEKNEKTHNHFTSALALYREFIKVYFGGATHSTVDIAAKETTHKPRKNNPNSLNSILYGAPGTGKTYSTVEFAVACIENREPRINSLTDNQHKDVLKKYKSYVDKGQIVFTTFHQSYGYEEFIQGLRPENVNGQVSFEIKPGVFMKIAQKAMKDPANNYVIIIDEINRGNISKIFGELITLIEPDKRYGEENVIVMTLPFGDAFVVPNNLYIIGTMNSADKSISLIDSALRRRFDFIEKNPNPSLIEDATLKKVLQNINEYLRNELKSSDLLIGHAYFINKSKNDLIDIINKNIIPLLYEYFYDDEAKVAKSIEVVKECGLEIVTNKNKRLYVRKKE